MVLKNQTVDWNAGVRGAMLRHDRDDGQADDVADDGRAHAAADGCGLTYLGVWWPCEIDVAGHALEVPELGKRLVQCGLHRLLRFFCVREGSDRVPGRPKKYPGPTTGTWPRLYKRVSRVRGDAVV